MIAQLCRAAPMDPLGGDGTPTGLVTVSSGLKQRLVELGIAAERVRVLRNGVDLALFHPHGPRRGAAVPSA